MLINEIWNNFIPSVKGNYKTRHAIRKWCELRHIQRVLINDDMTVTVDNDVRLEGVENIPFQFKMVQGTFDISDCTNLKSFKGCPYFVEGNFLAIGCAKITSLEFAPTHIGKSINANMTGIRSLHNVHKFIKQCGSHAAFGNATSNALGLLLIPGLQAVTVGHNQATMIMNQHMEDKDIHMCQQALLDAGFSEYAKL